MKTIQNKELAVDEESIGGDMPLGKIMEFSREKLTEEMLKHILVVVNDGNDY